MTKKPKEGVGPWAKEKLDALSEYLGFYTKVKTLFQFLVQRILLRML